MDRATIVHENFIERVTSDDFPEGRLPSGSLSPEKAISIFRSACISRCLDIESRAMQSRGQGFYTIGSSGHEGMAAVSEALEVKDVGFLHYRDAAFQIQRATKVKGQSVIWDMLLSFACSSEDPISGGRHKVLGSLKLNIPPQTSTIASHLPKAVGAAFSIGIADMLEPEHQKLASDSIVVCTFGDASANHSTAQGAFNTAQWTSYQSSPMPILFVCEDNGIGISTKTPRGWIKSSFSHREGLKYFECDGLDMYQTYAVTREASEYVRKTRKPAFLHVRTVRLYGHAGADVASSYLPQQEIEEAERNDPLLHSVRLLVQSDALSASECLKIYKDTLEQVKRISAKVTTRPRLQTAEDVMSSIIPSKRGSDLRNLPLEASRKTVFERDYGALEEPQIMSKLIRWSLTDLMLENKDIVMMGEDIGAKGGVYGVTQNLVKKFGKNRVINTLLDEQSILGLAIGMAQNGFIPIPEIQFLAYYHNAEDQIRGEAATLSFFSNGQYTNPMVIRVQGLGYQKGFGGHFHNDNSLAVLRDLPGVIVACPSNGSSAVKLLRECVRLAYEEQRIVFFIEPIALYSMRDLHQSGDGLWLSSYPGLNEKHDANQVMVEGEGTDIAIVSFGNGIYLANQALAKLEERGIKIRIVDLCWLAPIPEESLVNAVSDCERVLIVDETRRSGGVAEALVTLFTEKTDKPIKRICSKDSFIPTGPAYASTMPSAEGIIKTTLHWLEQST